MLGYVWYLLDYWTDLIDMVLLQLVKKGMFSLSFVK